MVATRRQVLASVLGTGALAAMRPRFGAAAPATPESRLGRNASGAMYRGNAARTGFTTERGPVDNVTTVWRFTVPGSIRSSPVVVDGVLYAGSDASGTLYAIEAREGRMLWSNGAEGEIASTPAVVGGVVYIGRDSGAVDAIGAADGDVRWSTKLGGAVRTSPAVVNELVVVGSDDDLLQALDAASGEPVWTVGTAVMRSRGGGNTWFAPSPAVSTGIVYAALGGSRFGSLGLKTGEPGWEIELPSDVGGTPAVVDGTIFVATEYGGLHALDTSDGGERWVFPPGGGVSSPGVADGVVYIGAKDGSLYAVDAASGEQIWQYQTAAEIVAGPTVTPDRIYVTSLDDSLVAVERASGEQAWSMTAVNDIVSSPAVADGMVYVTSVDGNIYAVGSGG